MDDVIASSDLLCVRHGEEIPVTLLIGTPYSTGKGSWACPARLEGLHPHLPDIEGEDSLQALCLAVSLVRQLIERFVAEGGRVYVDGPEGRVPFPLAEHFGSIGFAPPPPPSSRRNAAAAQ